MCKVKSTDVLEILSGGKQIIDNRIGLSFLFHGNIPIILVKIVEERQKPSSVKVGSIGLDAKSVMSWPWLAVLTLNGSKIPCISYSFFVV